MRKRQLREELELSEKIVKIYMDKLHELEDLRAIKSPVFDQESTQSQDEFLESLPHPQDAV